MVVPFCFASPLTEQFLHESSPLDLKVQDVFDSLYHHFMRFHMALDGKTPSDMAGIKIEEDNKWITLIQNSSKK